VAPIDFPDLGLDAFRQIFESIPDAVAIRSLRRGVFVAVNRELERMTGYSRSELLGRSPIDLGLWVDESQYNEGLSTLVNRGVVRNFEAHFRTKDGRDVPGLISAARVDVEDDSLIVSFVRDLTSRREAEKRDRLRKDLSAMLSHDIRTPLMAILNSLYVARLEKTSPEERAAAYDRIERSARAAVALAQSFIDVARIESGLLQPEVAPVSLNELVERAVRDQEGTARARRIWIQTILEGDLPVLRVDARLIERAISNLLSNALKFSRTDDSVLVRTRREQERVVLEVEDRGPGIPPAHRAQLFKRFATLGGNDDSQGLGLFVVRTFVEAHGGSVDADFPQSGGSIFRMLFAVE
jgi:PAS domain S-box-containing protein